MESSNSESVFMVPFMRIIASTDTLITRYRIILQFMLKVTIFKTMIKACR